MLALDRTECDRLLASAQIGRLVAIMPDGTPLIRPVNYDWDLAWRSIVIRTGRGTKLHAILNNEKVWFEVDELDPEHNVGWSVIVGGIAEEVTDGWRIRQLTHGKHAPWAPGAKQHCVRIRAVTVTGRRIMPAPRYAPAQTL